MIDVHILTLPDENKKLLSECIDSLRHENIILHISEGVEGHLGAGRSKAIKKGNSDWVGWVDSDDFIIPYSYNRLWSLSQKSPEIGFWWMNEEVWDLRPEDLNNPINRHINRRPHHMHIIHRDLIDYDIIENTRNDFNSLLSSFAKEHGKYVDETGYIWRKYRTSSCKKRGFGVNRITARNRS